MKTYLRVSSALITLITAFLFSQTTAFAGGSHSDSHAEKAPSRAITHAPIGVMADHMHGEGEFMMSYRFMHMAMDGNRIGSSRTSAEEITGTMMAPGRFMVAPTSMPMDMHMLGAMYGLSEDITLMAMLNFVSMEMDHRTRSGMSFTTESEGFGDTRLAAMFRLIDEANFDLHWTLGISLPTGSIDERDDTPAMKNAFLPYPMQLGSGTYDLLPSITAVKYYESWSIGGQASAEIRLSDNSEGYTLGDRYQLTTWIAKEIKHRLSASIRLSYSDRDNIEGNNPALNPMMIQTANTDLQAYQRTDLGLGVNYLLDNGHRLAFEYSQAIHQDVDGPQLETDSIITLGWQKAF